MAPRNQIGVGKHVTYFKPIGYYTLTPGFFTTKVEVTIVREFEDDYNNLVKSKKVDSNLQVSKLSLEENAILGAFSIEALIKAETQRDCRLMANGLKMDMYMTFEGFPQSFLDDSYGMEGPIGAYHFDGNGFEVAPMMYNKSIFDKLNEMSLLTVFKTI